MTRKPADTLASTNVAAASHDGRKLRSVRSREQIIKALFKLIRGGNMAPSAAQIAEEAGISLRTVFRHIDDMESLHREMSAQVEAEIAPILKEAFKSETWHEQLHEMIDRRVKIYEHLMPVKVAASLRRFHSSFLLEDYNRFLALERTQLVNVLPDHITSDETLLSALEMATSFQIWRRLRQDQSLNAAKAKAAITLTVEKLVADL